MAFLSPLSGFKKKSFAAFCKFILSFNLRDSKRFSAFNHCYFFCSCLVHTCCLRHPVSTFFWWGTSFAWEQPANSLCQHCSGIAGSSPRLQEWSLWFRLIQSACFTIPGPWWLVQEWTHDRALASQRKWNWSPDSTLFLLFTGFEAQRKVLWEYCSNSLTPVIILIMKESPGKLRIREKPHGNCKEI